MTYIEQVLKEKSKDKEQSILVAQWEFDERSIPSALNSIITMFPHYSCHDETHSICILNNIVKMLGKDVIERMSCTDMWLLLESAYCHDMGMIITADEQEREIDSEKFLKFFKMIANDMNHPLQKYTEPFEISEDGTHLKVKEQDFCIGIFDASRFLLAEYFRSMHASMSKSAIKNPWESIGLQSPRSIIPNRLYGILGDICEVHTKPFDSVLDLPAAEDGIGVEEAHPIFIACLLRLGDLLDIDNNRFSETLLRTIKDLSGESRLHIDKHKSISHLSVNKRNVEIEANCSTPRVAKVTQDWFDWIREEFDHQSQNWSKIVPIMYDCHLPTINYLRIKIDGYEKIDGQNSTRFNIDTPKALELLQGGNFYKNEFEAIREILQNAVDSTLMRIYLDAKKEEKGFNGIDSDFLEYARKYPIIVSVETEEDGNYKLTITDKGIGLKRDQLQYLTNTGSSSDNKEKSLIVDEMPEWMHPSGIFGIGFQSVFLLTDKVEIKTKDYFEDGKMWIEMHSPNGPMGGDIYLKTIEENFETGFTISFVINKEIKRKDKISDPFGASFFDFQRMDITNQVKEYGKHSFVPIKIKEVENKNEDFVTRRDDFRFFDKKTNVELIFPLEIFNFNKSHCTSWLYRNAKVSALIEDIMFVHPIVNIHTGNAKDFLELNRSSFKNKSFIKELTIKTMLNFMRSEEYDEFIKGIENIDKKISDNADTLFAFFLESVGKARDEFRIRNDVDKFNFNWTTKNDEEDEPNQKFNIKDVISKPTVHFLNQPTNVVVFVEKNSSETGAIKLHANSMPVGTISFFADISKLFFLRLSKEHKRSCCLKKIKTSLIEGAEYKFASEIREEEIEFTVETLLNEIKGISSPHYINYVRGYEKIRIPSNDCDSRFSSSLVGNINFTQQVDKILLPAMKFGDNFIDSRSDGFYEYVSEHTRTEKEIVIAEYDRLIEDIKKAMSKLNSKKKDK